MEDELMKHRGNTDRLHQASAVVEGDPKLALDRAVAVLTTVGFLIEQRRPDWVRLTGGGLNSTNQNPLLGASTIELRSGFGQLSLKAEMGGTRSLQRFIKWFPPLLFLALTLPWLVLVPLGVVPTQAIWVVALVAGIQLPLWLLLGPWVGRRIGLRSERALETLVHNAALDG